MYGWQKKILRIDLSRQTASFEPVPDEVYRDFLGGRGLAIKLLFDETTKDTDPMGPDNPLIFSVGPLNGTPFGSGRMTIMTRSPRNGFLSDGNIGGHFAPQLKYNGVDAMVIKGISEKPCMLVIDNGVVSFRSAEHLWGKTTRETERLLREEFDDTYQFRYIGPAGENCVGQAVIVGNLLHTGGRTGAGMVMGGKRLKAIVIRGNGSVKVADPDAYLKAYQRIVYELDPRRCTDVYRLPYGLYGDVSVNGLVNEYGGLAIENGKYGTVGGEGSFTAEKMLRITKKPKSCYGCMQGCCINWVVPTEGKLKGIGTQAHAGSLNAMGSNLRIMKLSDQLENTNMCCDLGLDTFVGFAIAWAFEAFEKGYLTTKDTDGLELRFGDNEAVQEMLKNIAYRRNRIGNLLADGLDRASDIVANGACKGFALQSKGVEYSTVNPRVYYNMALHYAISDVGLNHTRIYPPYPPLPEAVPADVKLPYDIAKAKNKHTVDDKGKFVRWCLNTRAVINSMETCAYSPRGRLYSDQRPYADLISAVTGEKFTAERLYEIGERICQLEHSFNVRNGASRKDDVLPDRWTKENDPTSGNGYNLVVPEELEQMIDDFYDVSGLDRNGIPKRETLERFKLGYVADQLGL